VTDAAEYELSAGLTRVRRYEFTFLDKFIAVSLAIGLACLLLWPFTLFVVPSGHAGVEYRLFTSGTDTTYIHSEGLGIKWPWNRIYLYDVRVQARDETVFGLTTNGLSILMKVTVLFRPNRERVGFLQKGVGQDYIERLVRPLAIAAVREVIGNYGPHDLYRVTEEVLQNEVLSRLQSSTDGLVNFEDVIFRQVELPEVVNRAISHKLTEEQNAEAYEYILEQARQEAERQRIKAIGIQTFYSIVANALTPQLLTWRGIEATVQLAQSNNTKIVVVGSGKDQLPLILGSDIATQPNLPAPVPVDPQAHPMPRLEDLPNMFPDTGPVESKTPDAGATKRSGGSNQSRLEDNAIATPPKRPKR
jgi:regulator of protease activity HflC (stomatin/prohibitin superfamily)